MRSAAAVAVAVTLAVVLAGCVGPVAEQLPGQDRTMEVPCDEEVTPDGGGGDRPADPAGDRLGWERGIWANETLGIDREDGLSCGELELVVERSMARVEQIRRLEFETMPTVRVVSREAYREQVAGGGANVSRARRAFENVKYEALFVVNESADAVGVQRRNRGTSVAAFYAPGADTVVLVTDDVSAVRVDETVLAHELVHALQDQHLPDVEFPGVEDTAAARRGVTEGDANYVQHLYERRCGGPWLGSCLGTDGGGERSGDGPGLANLGMYVVSYQPYSDGPPFVRRVRQRGGWAAVNDLYRDLPESTEQTIHPRLYPDEEPTRVRLADRSSDRWTRLVTDRGPGYETWGERGLFAMFVYAGFESEGAVDVVEPGEFLTPNGSEFDPYDYGDPASAGWAGDRLVAYRDAEGDLAYVWKIAFDTDRDARQFLDGYREVLRFRGAERVDGRPGVWRIPAGEAFADAFHVRRSGDAVVIVNAPTVDELEAVRAGVLESRSNARDEESRETGREL